MDLDFRQYIDSNGLVAQRHRILLAISGGVDSMVMLHLFSQCQWELAVAHCNFGLRGAESDGDEQLVCSETQALGIPFHVERFDTKGYAAKHKCSIQVAARQLRYQWFETLRKQQGYNSIAVAHNANDVAETLLLNLIRGTGLKGLTGIKPRNGAVIRPLLFARRERIENYASEKGLVFRMDSSNLDTKYSRNLIRNRIVPILETLNPSLIETLNETTGRLKAISDALCEDMENFHKKAHSQVAGYERYSIELLKQYPYIQEYMHEQLGRFGFSSGAVADCINSLQSQPGKEFFSASHRVVRDREFLLAMPLPEQHEKTDITIIPNSISGKYGGVKFDFEYLERTSNYTISKGKFVADFDADRVAFPLLLRHWEPGDWFVPLGMKGRKKISDFLVDSKISRPEKERVLVLLSGDEVIWVVGQRIDTRFAVASQTNRVLRITMYPTVD